MIIINNNKVFIIIITMETIKLIIIITMVTIKLIIIIKMEVIKLIIIIIKLLIIKINRTQIII